MSIRKLALVIGGGTAVLLVIAVSQALLLHTQYMTMRSLEHTVAAREDARQAAALDNSVAETTKERLEKLHHAFLSRDNVVAFLSEIELLAAARGIEVSMDSPDHLTKNQEEGITSITLTSSGGYQDTAAFFSQLENLPYVFRVQSALIEVEGRGEEGGARWSGSFTLDIPVI